MGRVLPSPWELEPGVLAQLGMSCVDCRVPRWKTEPRVRAGLYRKSTGVELQLCIF